MSRALTLAVMLALALEVGVILVYVWKEVPFVGPIALAVPEYLRHQ